MSYHGMCNHLQCLHQMCPWQVISWYHWHYRNKLVADARRISALIKLGVSPSNHATKSHQKAMFVEEGKRVEHTDKYLSISCICTNQVPRWGLSHSLTSYSGWMLWAGNMRVSVQFFGGHYIIVSSHTFLHMYSHVWLAPDIKDQTQTFLHLFDSFSCLPN